MAKLDEMTARVKILAAEKTEEGWDWAMTRTVWAAAKDSDRRTYLSAMAIGTRAAEFVFRRSAVPTMQNAIYWRDKLYYPAMMATEDRGLYTTVIAGEVEVHPATVTAYKETAELRVPAVLLEKYVRATESTPMTEESESYILTLPKNISLQTASLVKMEDLGVFVVMAAHTTDPYRNYYEILRRDDR